MKSLFSKSRVYDCDLYVADFTDDEVGKGVVFSTEPFDNKGAFHLILARPGEISYFAVNIEDYPAFRKGIQNCEAVMISEVVDANPKWALFLELKYCGSNRVDDYGPKAISQMDAVRHKLEDLGKLGCEDYIVHFNYCSPNNREIEPFDGFRETQSATLERVENDGVIFHARMELVVVNGSVILEKPVAV